ncbi:AbrB family transcriptional regulator [Paenibacillus alvei]|uniref:AbrB family transcriptional regulator n=1 Tax=Paenibacillus alvei TaxID=44250 RepID=UPI000684049A
MVGALALSVLLAALQSVSESTALLSLAPGGMEQMGIIAHEIQADLSMVSGYQIFRTLFISFAVPPLLQFLFRIMLRKRQADIIICSVDTFFLIDRTNSFRYNHLRLLAHRRCSTC